MQSVGSSEGSWALAGTEHVQSASLCLGPSLSSPDAQSPSSPHSCLCLFSSTAHPCQFSPWPHRGPATCRTLPPLSLLLSLLSLASTCRLPPHTASSPKALPPALTLSPWAYNRAPLRSQWPRRSPGSSALPALCLLCTPWPQPRPLPRPPQPPALPAAPPGSQTILLLKSSSQARAPPLSPNTSTHCPKLRPQPLPTSPTLSRLPLRLPCPPTTSHLPPSSPPPPPRLPVAWPREPRGSPLAAGRLSVEPATASSGGPSWWRWGDPGTRRSSTAITATTRWQTCASWRSRTTCTARAATESSSPPPVPAVTLRSWGK
ncbi:uncharacterized protein LOC136716287 [Amia ocellicauda]|uniref:uncharacterized protein LOC136716287 n=1 Tax=Amia ocellicauda TaxID=2972642 RepID=UPI0034645A28